MILAARRRHARVAQQLLAAGADPWRRNKHNEHANALAEASDDATLAAVFDKPQGTRWFGLFNR